MYGYHIFMAKITNKCAHVANVIAEYFIQHAVYHIKKVEEINNADNS